MPSPLSLIPRRAPPSVVNRVRSCRLGNVVESRPGNTYRDALRALSYADRAVYVEGFVVVADRVETQQFEHAWLEVSGVVLDVAPQFQHGPIPTYFRAFAWTRRDIASLRKAHPGLTPPFAAYRPDGARPELEWRDAALAAARHRAAVGLALKGVEALGDRRPA